MFANFKWGEGITMNWVCIFVILFECMCIVSMPWGC